MGDTTDETFDDDAIETVRLAVLAVRDTERVPASKIAALAGIPTGTLTPWLVRQYAGNNAKIAATMRRWLDARDSQRRSRAIQPLVPGFVRTTSAAGFLDALEYAHTARSLVTITGGPGVGKTMAVAEYQRLTPNVWVMTVRPSTSNLRPMLAALVAELGLPELAAGRRNQAVVRKLADSGGLVIVDEAQHLQVTALEELRSIYDATGIGLALVGNEQVYARLDGQGRTSQFAQLFSRVAMRHRRAKSQPGDILAIADAWGISDPAERKLLRAIGGRPGALRGITQTLRQAHMLALGEAAEGAEPVITAAHIARAYSRVSDQPVDTLTGGEGA